MSDTMKTSIRGALRAPVASPVLAAVVAAATLLIAAAILVVVSATPGPDAASATTGAVEEPASPAVTPEALAVHARSQGLRGRSPAGLTARADTAIPADVLSVYTVYRDVARYADAHDLHGLSPAGLAPVGDRTTAR